MIRVYCIGHNFTYELMELLKLFLTPEEINMEFDELPKEILSSSDSILICEVNDKKDTTLIEVQLYHKGLLDKIFQEYNIGMNNPLSKRKAIKQLLKKCVLLLMKKHYNKNIPWGILTGIRPAKIVHELIELGYDEKRIHRILVNDYLINHDKATLLITVAKKQSPIIFPIREEFVSLYISVPFCPTRCIYCSFPSNPLPQWQHLQKPYVDALIREIIGVGKLLKDRNKKIECIYIGGGTPSTLTAQQIKEVLSLVKVSFNLRELKEFTFEAGRPDTITQEKLMVLKEMGVNRISINPQTMNNCTLMAIGRGHTVDQFKEAYNMAKKVGFDNINIDLIIGLPSEDSVMFENTMKQISKLEPTNVTVHTLAIKRASALKEDSNAYCFREEEVMEMIKVAHKYTEIMGLEAYYLYRQKHMLGHLENIGYSKAGYEGIYNIQIMEEKQTIVAMGAGAISKIVYPSENRIERVANVKNLQQYIDRIEEMLARKRVYL